MAYEVERTEDFGKGYLQDIPETQPMQVQPAGFAGMTPAVAREVAQIQGQIMLAKMYPRNMKDVWNKVEGACSRKNLASHAIYRYARGGTDISGPSIRLAEALINAYGNAKSGFEVIESDSDSSRVRSYAYDMETNTLQERTFDVPHIRETKKGRTKLTDPRDIYETIANQASRRERACILALLPSDLVEFAVSSCYKTLEQTVDLNPAKIRNMVESFAKYGVSQVMIEARIQRHVDAMTVTHFVDLLSIGEALRDGVGTIDQYFDLDAKPLNGTAAAEPEKPQQPKASSKKTAAKAQHAAEPAPAPQPEPAPATEGSMAMDDEGISAAFDSPMAGPESFDEDDSLEGFYDRA